MIDLSQLPAPDYLQPEDFETIYAGLKARMIEIYPDATATLQLDSDPLAKTLQRLAYEKQADNIQKNHQVKQSMLAYAVGPALDVRCADYDVQRNLLVPENLNAIPPQEAVYEDDESLRQRALLAWEKLSTAGPIKGYEAKALFAHPNIRSARAKGPVLGLVGGVLASTNDVPLGVVKLAVLSRAVDGIPTTEELAAVELATVGTEERPITDYVQVIAGAVSTYSISATLYLYEGPDKDLILQKAQESVEAYTIAMFKLGFDVTRSGIIAALTVPGVQDVDLSSPANSITNAELSAARCTAINILFGGRRE